MKFIISLIMLFSFSFSFDFLFTQAFISFKKGINFEKTNPKYAQKYFQKTYILLNQIKNNSSQKYYMLGKLYCNGWGVDKDYKKAEYYFKMAIKLGNQRANCCLARLYIKEGRKNLAKKYLKYALAHDTLAHYCNDINPQTLTIIKGDK